MNKLIPNLLALVNLIKIPRTFSWETVIRLSILFWIVAFLLGGLTGNLRLHNIFSFLGCLVILCGYAWFTVENPLIVQGFSLSTWILVEVICLFMASLQPKLARLIWMIWPALSATFAAWPEFIAAEWKLIKLKNEQGFKLLIWLLIHLVISCWINFSLIIQDWVLQYPSLLADDLSQSDFVVKFQPFSRPTTGGERVLNAMEQQLKTKLDGKLWVVAENWLKDTNQLKKLLPQAKQRISGVKEKDLWKFRTKVAAQKTGYNLSMIAEWLGPSSNPHGYLLTKVCQVNPVTRQPTPVNNNLRRVRRKNNAQVATIPQVRIIAKPVKIAHVQCQSVSKEIIEKNQQKKSPKL
ncbi:DUF5357 family protein [Aerosakkonemataceae cyanobacterium BLCC-F50]|uniref:DUF5357 family protein n=1 Tax=Floridaenema flaviceps BLCC-F50 TaxID=3153642 RepID=A0ABV4XJK0_9CYAN